MKIWIVAVALVAGCATVPGALNYAPTVAIQPQPAPSIGSVTVIDARDEPTPTFIGSIRNGWGAPIKDFVTIRPVKDDVQAAFVAALKARGLYNPAAPASLAVTLTQLSADQFARREGHTIFQLALLDHPGGRALFQDSEDVLKINGSLLGFDKGPFASIDDLRAVTDLSLSTAIDQALDNPGFAAAR